MKTGIVKDRRYLQHDMGAYHPENPGRLEVLYKMLDEEITFPYLTVEPRAATEEEIELIHTPAYFSQIKETAGKERVYLDPDTSTSALSYETALLAAGGLLKAVDLIMDGSIKNAFALIRPPGHHAEASRAMGFCIFNNVAIAAEYLIKKRGLQRILIVDWDVHHGNGTQAAFYSRRDVLYFSTHQVPLYPGSGAWTDTGTGEGEGYTVNVPLYAGKGDDDFLFVFQNILFPVARQYKPEFILVSAGFDICDGDTLGGMRVTGPGFALLTAELLSLARACSQDRIALSLEGGYDYQALKAGVKSVLLRLSDSLISSSSKAEGAPNTRRELEKVFEMTRRHWKI
jgi:acetoin utilization deacetylase AcuC-like enzyme